jgi:hypothetical protein
MFLVPKPGANMWRLIIDLRELNNLQARGFWYDDDR